MQETKAQKHTLTMNKILQRDEETERYKNTK